MVTSISATIAILIYPWLSFILSNTWCCDPVFIFIWENVNTIRWKLKTRDLVIMPCQYWTFYLPQLCILCSSMQFPKHWEICHGNYIIVDKAMETLMYIIIASCVLSIIILEGNIIGEKYITDSALRSKVLSTFQLTSIYDFVKIVFLSLSLTVFFVLVFSIFLFIVFLAFFLIPL